MHSIVISKIRANNPNKKSSSLRNYNYMVYMGTRPGTDLTTSNDELPGHGLFGNISVNDIHNIAKELSERTRKGEVIYNGFVSLSREDAKELGYNNKQSWEIYMQSVMPTIGRYLDIPIQNLEWAAAVHMEEGHPHCHYMLWNKEKRVKSSFIHVSKQNKIREYLSGEFSKEERLQEAIDKTAARDCIITFGKEKLAEVMKEIEENTYTPSVPERMSKEQALKMNELVLRLLPELPTSGRLNYQFMPSSVKQSIDVITDELLRHKDIAKTAQQYYENLEALSDSYSASPKHKSINTEIGKKDLYKRIGNIILKECKVMMKSESLATNIPSSSTDEGFDDITNENIDFEVDEESIALNIHKSNIPDNDEMNSEKFTIAWSRDYKQALNMLYEQKDANSAEKLLLREIRINNNVLAYEQLGKLHKQNILEESDPEKADFYYKEAFKGFTQLHATEPSKSNYLSNKLGKFNEQGLGTEVNYEKAMSYYESAAGYKYADFSLANMYLYEKTEKLTPENLTKALNLLESSAKNGFDYAAYSYAKTATQYHMASAEKCNEFYSTALFSFLKNENKDDKLLYRIGTMYYNGYGTQVDYETAYKYFMDAAELKNPDAYYALAKTYADRKSTHYSPQLAEKYFTLAIEAGKLYAYSPLARLYLDKDSTLYNPEKAHQYLKLAIENEDSNALVTLGSLYLWGGHTGIETDPDKGMELINKAKDNGVENVGLSAARFYLFDDTQEKTIDKMQTVLSLLKDDADKGNKDAMYQYASTASQYNLLPKNIRENYYKSAFDAYLEQDNKDARMLQRIGNMYYRGQGTATDVKSAASYFKQAIDAGSTTSYGSLGRIYLDKKSSLYNPQDAVINLELAVENDDNNALVTLGCLYLWGCHPGIEDPEKGLALLEKAKNNGVENVGLAAARFYLYDDSPKSPDKLKEALSLLKEDADQGNADAMYQYASTASQYHLLTDDICQSYFTSALKIYLEQENKDAYALHRLGNMYYRGQGTATDVNLAESYFKQAIDAGSVTSYGSLARIYLDKKCSLYNPKDAVINLELAIENEDNNALVTLGCLYLWGCHPGIEDPDKGLALLEKAKENGVENVNLSAARFYLYDDSPKSPDKLKEALSLLKTDADQGNADAMYQYASTASQYHLQTDDICQNYFASALKKYIEQENKDEYILQRLANMYYKGQGTECDFTLSESYYKQAIDTGSLTANGALARLYLDKDSPCYNPAEAINNLEIAIKNEDYNSLVTLGSIYLWGGHGIPENQEKGMQLLNEAIIKGAESAKYTAACNYLYDGSFSKSPDSLTQALSLLKEAADQGIHEAAYLYAKTSQHYHSSSEDECQFYFKLALDNYESKELKDGKTLYRLGTMYYKGQGTERSITKAYSYFKASAEQDDPDAYYALAKTYADKESPYYSPSMAEKYFLLSIKNENFYAYSSLARLYLDKDSPCYNPSSALFYLNEGNLHNDINSTVLLGRLYLWGGHPGIERDISKGKALLQMAMASGSETAKNILMQYEQVKDKEVVSCCYSIFRNVFATLESDNHKKKHLPITKIHSKEQQRAEIKKREI